MVKLFSANLFLMPIPKEVRESGLKIWQPYAGRMQYTDLIADSRDKNGLSLADVAVLSGVSRAYVQVIERGTKIVKGKPVPHRTSDQNILAVSYAAGADVKQVIKLAGISISPLELQRIECEVRLRAAGRNGVVAALKTLRRVTILPAEA
ncbi:helix-turn-helix domain-containing protein [Corynebacterium pseudogenitalium]|uniref:helix-turn-helix domain-containing protein n=1 Tax=Corynebacterium pseudogenitalium TaxID=38303 RepID=UPI003BA38584